MHASIRTFWTTLGSFIGCTRAYFEEVKCHHMGKYIQSLTLFLCDNNATTSVLSEFVNPFVFLFLKDTLRRNNRLLPKQDIKYAHFYFHIRIMLFLAKSCI